MKYILIILIAFMSTVSSCNTKSNITPNTLIITHCDTEHWHNYINHTMDSLRAMDVKGIEQTYTNAWIDGANTILGIYSDNHNARLSDSYIEKRRVADSIGFSNNFRKRNNLK